MEVVPFLCLLHKNMNTLNLSKIFDNCALNIILLREYFKALTGNQFSCLHENKMIIYNHFPVELIEILGKLLAKVLLSNINLICGDFCKVEYDKNVYVTGLGSHKMVWQRKIYDDGSTVTEFTRNQFYSAMLTKSGNLYVTEKDKSKDHIESRKLMTDIIKVSFHEDYILMLNKRNEMYIYSTHPVKIYGCEPFKMRDDAIDIFCCERFFGFVTTTGDVYNIFYDIDCGNLIISKTVLTNIKNVSGGYAHFLALDTRNVLHYWGAKKGRPYSEKIAPNVVKFTAGKNCMMYMNSRLEIYVCTHYALAEWKKVEV